MKVNVMNDLLNYQSKQGYFGKKFIWKNSLITELVKWWKFLDHISKVAVRILTAPCTFAATERTFSTFS